MIRPIPNAGGANAAVHVEKKGGQRGPLRILKEHKVMTTKQKTNANAETKPAPAIIVFGVDQTGKHRAAAFAADQAELANKAAGLMQLRVLNVSGDGLTELAAQLPVGRIYASGHGFVPPIRPNLYERLTNLANPKPAPGLPASWDDVDVGHLVLAQEIPGEGWWEVVVVARNNDMLTLKWRDYPKYPQLVCHRAAVALLKPTAATA
jgi:hypothetical protein